MTAWLKNDGERSRTFYHFTVAFEDFDTREWLRSYAIEEVDWNNAHLSQFNFSSFDLGELLEAQDQKEFFIAELIEPDYDLSTFNMTEYLEWRYS